jgi:hypothetical protein
MDERMIKAIIALPAAGLACFLLMGNTGCQSPTHVQTGMGVYTGLTPPAVSTTGEWVHTGGAHWSFLAAASGAVATAALAQAVDKSRFVIEATHDNVIHLAWVQDPCSGHPGDYPMAQWTIPVRNKKFGLNCDGLRSVIRNAKSSGRMKNLYNCIGAILRKGGVSYDAVFRSQVYTYGTGKVWVTGTGSVVRATPIDGSWKTCAKA